MIKLTFKLLVILFVSSCGASNIDFSEKHRGKCYKLLKPSVLYKGWCASILSSFSSPRTCVGVQSFPIKAHDKENSILVSFSQYQDNKKFWDKKLFGSSLLSSNYELLDSLSSNTKLQLTNVVKRQWGTDGYYWAVRALILSGKYKGQEVTIPTYDSHLGQAWAKRPSNGDFYLDSDYLKSCDAKAE